MSTYDTLEGQGMPLRKRSPNGVAWWIEAESKRDRVENRRYLLVDGRGGSRVRDRMHHYLRYEANAQQALREGAGVISPLGVGTWRGSDTRRCLGREVNARHIPRRGAGAVDSLWPDSQRGVASCLATVGTLRESDTRHCLRCEDNTRHVPCRGAGVVDSLWSDSRRGAASWPGHGCPVSSSSSEEGGGANPGVPLLPRWEVIIEFAAAGRADDRCCCRAAGGVVPCRSCCQGT
jgi:hypothetical protein